MHHPLPSRAKFLAALALVLAGAALLPTARAGSTRLFELDDEGAFGKGELDGASVYSDGTVRLGASKDRVELPGVPVAWSALRQKDGSVLIGTGNDGKLLRVTGDKVSTFAETKQLLVSALAAGPGGAVYAGTLPEGRIFRIDAAGKASEFARLDGTKHIWGLLWDAKRNALIAATGPEGKLLAIDGKGKVTVLFDADAAHLMSVARDENGDLYVGTGTDALVYRVGAGKAAALVHDFPGTEITALAVRSGELLVAANAFDEPRSTGDDKDSKKKDAPPAPKSGDGQLWRLSAAGVAELLLEQKKDFLTEVAFGDGGTAFAATGKEGKVLRVLPDLSVSTWLDLTERQVLAFDLSGASPFVVTSDGAAFYWVRTGSASKGLWTSAALDAGTHARFGELTWRASGPVTFETRSGNTEKPGDTWSAWSEAVSKPGPVRSPRGRYLQIRAKLGAADAVLYAVGAYYLRDNQRARVESVTAEPQGRDKDKDNAAPPKASSVYKLSWRVDNPDGDALRYRVRFQREGERRFRELLEPHQVWTQTNVDWETNSIPDGFYVVEVEASDELSNPDGLTQKNARRSEPILIDNHAPAIESLSASGRVVRGVVTDSLGPIRRLEFAVNGGPWTVLFPEDDLFDTAREAFAFRVPDGAGQDPIVAVRAQDAAGNLTTREITLPAK